MIDGLAIGVQVACAVLALYGIGRTVANLLPGRATRVAVVVVEVVLVVQAAIAAVIVLAGTQLPETSTFLIYLVVSVGLLPIATQFASAEPSRWSGSVIAIGAIAAGVVVWRLQNLWVPSV